MLLEEEVPNTTPGPVGAEAGASLQVKDFDTLADGFNNSFLRVLERCLKLGRPRELAVGAEKRLEGAIMSRTWA